MGQWLKTNLWGLVAGFVIGGLLVGGVLSSAADQIYGKTAQSAQSAASSSLPINSSFPAATNQDQLTLFQASQNACDDINRFGAKVSFQNGGYMLIGQAKDSAGNPTQVFANFSPTGDVRGAGMFNDAPPIPCYPASLNQQVVRGNHNQAVEFMADLSSGGTYMWHSHLGSDALTNVYLTVSDGTIASYVDLNASDSTTASSSDITYGLTTDEMTRLVAASGLAK